MPASPRVYERNSTGVIPPHGITQIFEDLPGSDG